MNESREVTVDSVTLAKSSMNLYNTDTPAHTNLNLNTNPAGANESMNKLLPNDFKMELSDVGIKEDANHRDSRLELRLKIKDLEVLKKAFDSYEEKHGYPAHLNKREFVEFLTFNLNQMGDEEYEELFDNIDVSQSGTVDWDKFASYMLIMLYESDDRMKAFSIPNWKPIKSIHNPHRDSIRRVEYIKNMNRYVSISKEGTCCMYDKSSNVVNSNKIYIESCKSKDLWVTDFAVLQNINKVVISFTTKEIAIYELTTKLDFNCQYRINHLKATPLCLDYWYDPVNPNDSILSWGDTLGEVHTIHFNSTTIALFERPSSNVKSQNQSSTDTCLDININEIKETYKNAMYIHLKAHTSWVRQVKWIKHLDCLISCATTSKQSVCMSWFVKKSSHIRVSYSVPIRSLEKMTYLNIINGGVNGFDFDTKLNLLATANQNTLVNLFNPYVNEPNGILKGHSRVVLAVKFMPSRSQLISFSADKILRIWNVTLQICIQRVANIFPKGPEVDISCNFDEYANRLYIAFRYTLLMMEIKPEITDRVLTHTNSVVAARYNKLTNQIVTLSQDGSMYVWLIENGQKIKSFHDLHESSELITMEFDETNTRIYTTSSDGSIKIWDFNGHCYHKLEANEGQNCEIAQVLGIKRRIIAVGWNKTLTAFKENTFKQEVVAPSEWKGNIKIEHEEDILCAALMKSPPMFLATGSFDGEIVIWNSVTELACKHLTSRKRVMKIKENTNMSIKSNRSVKSTSNKNRRLSKHEMLDLSDPDKFIRQNDFSYGVTCLRFLDTRAYGKDATLISCGGNGWVRFWDVANEKVCAEFKAHDQVSSIIMEKDESEKYLGTGDVNGIVKIWKIDEYCLNPGNSLIRDEPPLVSIIHSHNDSINSIDFCTKNDKMFVIIASSDCSVSLNDLYGNLVGIFGQENHWKIDQPIQSTSSRLRPTASNEANRNANKSVLEHESSNQLESIEKPSEPDLLIRVLSAKHMQQSNDQDKQESETARSRNADEHFLPKIKNKILNIETTFEFENDAFLKDTSLRYNPWSKTILGKTYQELRTNKRERKQPGFIQSEEFIAWDKTGQAPGGIYGSLELVELKHGDEEEIKKQMNSLKYLRNKNGRFNAEQKQAPKPIQETVRAAFDEKTLFPKYILDFEARMRQEHKTILSRLARENESLQLKKKRSSMTSVNN